MHTIGTPVDVIFSTLRSFCSTLSAQFAQLVSHPSGTFGVAAFIVASLVLAIGCAVWALIERTRRSAYRGRMRKVQRRAQVDCSLRDAILESLPETVVVLRSKAQEPLSFGGGATLLQKCLHGPDARPLAAAINDLLKSSAGFSLSVRMPNLRQVFVRGVRVGGAAALFLRAQEHFAGTAERAPVFVSDGASVPRFEKAGVQTAKISKDGAIIIGTDGRLKRWNREFARQWSLRDDELQGEPLWTQIAARSIARNGPDIIWDIVSYAATTTEPERLNDWGTVTRRSGKPLSLSISRLKDGATLVRFSDATPSPEVSGRMAA